MYLYNIQTDPLPLSSPITPHHPRQYYQHNDRQAEAMELLEAAALTPSEEVKLPERVNHLREAIQCAMLAQVRVYIYMCVRVRVRVCV